jgi:subtilisin family serine protease
VMGDRERASPVSSTEAFSGLTGRGVRVAVIDSGVNPRHPHVNGIAGGIAIGLTLRADAYLDGLGHGTAVLAAIKEKAPEAEYYAVRIYYRSLRTNIDFLLKAIDWAIDENIDVVNLSLGTSTVSHRGPLLAAVERATDSRVLLVAASEMDGLAALPGSLPGVIGVGLDWTCPRNVFRHDSSAEEPRWFASGYPRSLPGVPLDSNLSGISFSVANMTGFVVRACEAAQDRSLPMMCRVLREEAERINTVDEQSRKP